ncbi:hypothetical protein [Comamonas sp. MYb396]|uniref:hypothetical protein n=1 Tax=Comamonas sp. MYb396 TaxID=2745302 RepID=UPI0030A810CA
MSNIFTQLAHNIRDLIVQLDEFLTDSKSSKIGIGLKSELNRHLSHLKNIIKSRDNNPLHIYHIFVGAKDTAFLIVNSLEKETQNSNINFSALISKLNSIRDNINNISSESLSESDLIEQFEIYKNEISNLVEIHGELDSNKSNKSINQIEKMLSDLKEDIIKSRAELSTIKDSISTIKESAKENITSAIEEIKSQSAGKSKELIEYINTEIPKSKDRLQNLNNLHGTEAGNLLAQHYQKAAKSEYLFSNIFRFLVICFLGTAIVTSILALGNIESSIEKYNSNAFMNNSNDRDYIFYVITKISIVLILLAGASWLSKESNKHRQRGNDLSNKEIALNTIDLYFSSLNNNDLNKVKVDLSQHFFTNQKIDNSDNENFDLNDTIKKLIEKIPNPKN